MNHLEIVILDADQRTLDKLTTGCKALDSVTVQKVDRVLYTHPPLGIDALFLVLPAAEKWGAKPLPGRAQVLVTSAEDQRDGMPPYVVTGVVLRPGDPRGPLPETKMLMRTALDAVREFNLASGKEKIGRLAFWAVNLLNGVTPEQLSAILTDVL
jgi:hypothetical protein